MATKTTYALHRDFYGCRHYLPDGRIIDLNDETKQADLKRIHDSGATRIVSKTTTTTHNGKQGSQNGGKSD